MSVYRALMRRKLLEELYDKMSDEDKATFAHLTMQDKSHEEIMRSLQGIKKQIDDGKHSFASDLLANVSGNAIWDAVIGVGKWVLKGRW